MFQNVELMLQNSSTSFWLAQVPMAQPGNMPQVAVFPFSGPQFFVALIAGVILAFGFQFLLTNLSIAAKISDENNAIDVEPDDDDSFGDKIKNIEVKVGSWILLTVNIALFTACFLAVKLTFISNVGVGAIVGLVIWSAYFLLLLWLGSTAVGSLVGSLVNTATAGLQGVMGTAGAAIGANAVNSQVVNTVEASVAAVRRELSSAVDPDRVRDTLDDYLTNLQVPKFDLKDIRSNFEKLLNESDLRSLAGSDILGNIDRQTFVNLVSSRTDLSKQDLDRIADQLEAAWNQVIKQRSPKDSGDGGPREFAETVGKQLDETRYEGRKEEEPGLLERAMQVGTTALMGAVLKNTDFSNLDVEKVSGQLQQVKDKASEQAQKIGSQVGSQLPGLQSNPILGDVENYILNSKPWHLNRETIKQEFKDVIYDPEAASGAVRPLLEQLNKDSFVQLLERRGNFSPEQINEISEQLEGIRQEVLETVQNSDSEEQSQDLRSRIENYLRSTKKEELNPEGIERDFAALLEDPEAGFDALKGRLSQFDRDSLVQLLGQREDFNQEEADKLIGQLESTRDRVLSNAQQAGEQAQSQAREWQEKIESYLRNTNKEELNPEGIKRDLQTLLDDPQAGFKALRERLSHFDRDTLVQLLNQRQDLGEEQINQITDQFESVRSNVLQAPQKVAGTAKEQYEQITLQIADYLRNTNLEELDPKGIKQDLTKLFEDPKTGALALRDRLSQIDRETLVTLLSQQGLSEQQIDRSIDRIQGAIRSIVKSPRRLADRAKSSVSDFQASLESYLRNTNKEELNPEGITRDLQLLLSDPGAGIESWRDRLSQFDRSTFVSLLSQREDISEEEANQIADRILSVRDRLVEQIQNVQDKVLSVINGISGRIQNYLNSLDRPELNYEGITRDFRKLFEDPEAGSDALKGRLSQFDRGTLVSILSSREDISEEDANRIVERIESARDSVLHRAERLQAEAKRRMKELKHQVKERAEETREVAANAAWWLFGTAVTSAISAAIAGVLAVGGMSGITGLFG